MRQLRRVHSTLILVLALAGAGPARALLAEEPAAPEPPVSAEPEIPVVPEEPPAPSERWRPPAPDPKSFEWLRLKSGEWLKGEIDYMRDETLYFDSEELDDLEIDWDNIVELRSPRIDTYLFDDRVVHTGTAVLRDGKILVSGAEEVWEYDSEELVGIVGGGASEWDLWHLKFSAGISTRSGNVNQVDINSSATIRRESALTRFLATYNGAISTVDEKLNTNTHRAGSEFNVYLSRRLYWVVSKVDVFSDEFQNVNVRVTPSTGLGYDVIDWKNLELGLDLGLGYQWTRFDSVDPDADRTETTTVLIPGVTLDLDITKRLDLSGRYFAQLAIPDTSKSNQHADATLSFEITRYLDLDLSFFWDRVENPAPDRDGNVPLRDDYRTVISLGIDL